MSAIDIVLTHRLLGVSFAAQKTELDEAKQYEFSSSNVKIAVFCPVSQPSSVRVFGKSIGYEKGTTEYDELFVFYIKDFLGVYRIGQTNLYVDCTLDPPVDIHGEAVTTMRLILYTNQ